MTAKSLNNDCFALPPGVHWTPVDQALTRLDDGLSCVVGSEDIDLANACGRTLARDVEAARDNPPFGNSAVDGFAFIHSSALAEGGDLSLLPGRAAAGKPFEGRVEEGQAVRILTGAPIPKGTDTVILQEDVTVQDNRVLFGRGIGSGANTRDAGEDFVAGDSLLSSGHRVRPQDIATLAAAGIHRISVFQRLRVGVLSTGSELCDVGDGLRPGQIADANRPMLLALLNSWGYEAVDIGRLDDDRTAIASRLRQNAATVDAILTSGGASAGDEDHISAILNDLGTLNTWRIAIKPGRPLALGLIEGMPVFGLPGNPVAAFVCALIFVRPALSKMSGAGWHAPKGMNLPAGFAKSKKDGRREYLRARRNPDDTVEVFKSEGSGRISGLSWANGIVELPDPAMTIAPGDPVRFIPFEEFGI